MIQPTESDESAATPAGQQSYRVYAHNYQDLIFDHWEDGSTTMVRDITIGENTTITVYYSSNQTC